MTTQPDYEANKAVLIAELAQLGIKHTPQKIVRITKLSEGKIIFLEEGDDERGLQHILAKAKQFANIGINEDEILDAVMAAVTTGKIVGYQGKSHNKPRAIYEFTFKGDTKFISLSVANNGYIVGANPRTKPK
ncbi:MAG: hypothetical protein KME29_27830 [Calothrix sp. FI2-JRJ7]|nr:hypothetical protein [Calothrix sp. FI2-JRJ7]